MSEMYRGEFSHAVAELPLLAVCVHAVHGVCELECLHTAPGHTGLYVHAVNAVMTKD